MELSKLIILLLFSKITLSSVEIKKDFQKLQEIETKQVFSNLRYISKSGKVTIYQNENGDLSLSKNYKINIIHKSEKYTKYDVIEGTKNFLLILKDDTYYSHINPAKPKKIYILDLETQELKKIGEGLIPQFHLEDTWISFYRPSSKTLVYKKLTMPPKTLEIKINGGH